MKSRQAQEYLEVHGAELIAAYEVGTPLSVLADSAGICAKTLSRFLVAQGARLRHDRGWYKRRRRAGG